MKKISNTGFLLIFIVMMALFLPVFLCILVFGNNMDYYSFCKLPTLLPNAVLFAIVLIALMVWIITFYFCRKIKLSTKQGLILDFVLLLFFVVLYFINVEISRNTSYYTGWDPNCVRGYAYLMKNETKIGYDVYLTIYPTNIPISFILGKLYIWATELKNYSYNGEFIWNQVGCLFLSSAGFATCISVKKVTGNFVTTLTAFLLYVACIGITPWKNIPYTDIYAVAFPIFCICFYLYYRDTQKKILKILFLFLTCASGIVGGIIKPTVYIVLIAVFIVEILHFLKNRRERWMYVAMLACCTVALILTANQCQDKMVSEMGLELNPEIAASWQHYFYMGLNENTTGGYNSSDVAAFGQFQFRPQSERNAAELDWAFDRIQERGLVGTLYFWLRKMVMTFNDGTFGWGIGEASLNENFAPIADNNKTAELLRDIFWPHSLYSGRYNTFCQLVWLFCLTNILGICLCKRENRESLAFFPLCFIGIFLYLMLFEARARYLICFVPLIVTVSMIGLHQYALRAIAICAKFFGEKAGAEN